MDSMPLLRLHQNCSSVVAPGTRRAMPIMAMSVADVSPCSVMATLKSHAMRWVCKVQKLGEMHADEARAYRACSECNYEPSAVHRKLAVKVKRLLYGTSSASVAPLQLC